MNKRDSAGFTLIELLTVLIVFGVLAAFAIPGYQQQVENSRRADAKVHLSTLAQQQELFFTRFRTYTPLVQGPSGCVDAACGLNQATTMSPDGHYNVTAAANATSYTLTAIAIGVQFNDTDCRVFTINNAGVQTAVDSGGADNTDDCW